jgi:hypothetical protein
MVQSLCTKKTKKDYTVKIVVDFYLIDMLWEIALIVVAYQKAMLVKNAAQY